MDGRKITVDQLDSEQRLHLSILHGARAVCEVVQESFNPKITFDKDATALIGEIVWKKLQEVGGDLEHFAKHAKRTTINSSDVLLLTRRNPSLTEHLLKLVKVGERKKRKSDGTVANAAPTEAQDNEIDLNAESNDGVPKAESREESFDLGDDVDAPMILLSDDD